MKALTVSSIILGVLSILVCFTIVGGFVFAIPAIILAHLARRKTPVADRGKPLIAAFVLSYGGLALELMIFIYLAFFADWR